MYDFSMVFFQVYLMNLVKNIVHLSIVVLTSNRLTIQYTSDTSADSVNVLSRSASINSRRGST